MKPQEAQTLLTCPLNTSVRVTRVLDQVLASVDGRKPVWMSEPDDFVTAVAQRAPLEFDRAFDRWRELVTLPPARRG